MNSLGQHGRSWLDYVLISNIHTAEDEGMLAANGITHVYSLLEFPSPPLDLSSVMHKLQIKHRYVRIDDCETADILAVGRKWYRQIDRDRREPRARILFHCAAGQSRSASLLLYHLMRSWRMPFHRAYQILKDARPEVLPNLGFFRQLRDWDQTAQSMRYLLGCEALFILHKAHKSRSLYTRLNQR